MERCVQSAAVTSPCLMCGSRAEKMHRPMFHRGTFCPRCCPVCAPTGGPRNIQSSQALRTLPAHPANPSGQGATQWQDAGWGPRADDPWYHDGERRDPQPRWAPPRPHWFK
jgi:hypothetical protein